MAPAVLNSFYSLYLKEATGNTITVTNKPLPLSSSEQVSVRYYNNYFYFTDLLLIYRLNPMMPVLFYLLVLF